LPENRGKRAAAIVADSEVDLLIPQKRVDDVL
jgi:hypothetical protein